MSRVFFPSLFFSYSLFCFFEKQREEGKRNKASSVEERDLLFMHSLLWRHKDFPGVALISPAWRMSGGKNRASLYPLKNR